MSQNKVSAWKKTAVATVAFSMLAGSATGLASAHGRGDGENRGNQHDKQNDNNEDGQNNRGNSGGYAQVRYNLNFNDLNQQGWDYAPIIRMCAEGVFKGYEDGSFKPQNNVTRMETIIAAVRLLGLEAEAQKPENMNAKLNFADFNKLKLKYPQAVGYVEVALKHNLFNVNDNVIQAEKPATRLWASILLVKAMKLDADAQAKMDAQLPFLDAEDIPAGSVGYVAVALDKGLVAGYDDKTFRPNKLVTRAELAAILSRLGVQLPDNGGTNNNPGDNQAVTGTITVSANGTLTIQKSDGTTVNIPLDAGTFVFRQNVKAPITALVVGDQILVRTYQGKAVFIEVTTAANTAVQFTDTGRINAFTFNAQGKLATLSVTKDVNGTATTVVYNVDANVAVTGGSGVLASNLNVVLKGENNIVKSVQIVS